MSRFHFTNNMVLNSVDIDVAEVLRDNRDFSPFPNKVFALMYFLRNSPKPVVSTLLFSLS